MPRPILLAACAAAATAVTLTAAPQTPPAFMPVSEVRAGMTGIGRTIYAGDTQDAFDVTILGAIDSALAPGRTLILAKLSGGPLAETGVIAGMSGSPVYIGGRLVGAVSYSLGSFPRQPIAGITPIADMLADIDHPDRTRPRSASPSGGRVPPPATLSPSDALSALARALGTAGAGSSVDIASPSVPGGHAAMRPIGAAWTLGGWDAGLGAPLASALGVAPSAATAARPAQNQATAGVTLRPGDAVGASLMRGDFETGATGTVTWVDGQRVYAFGHPFLAGGPVTMPMTRARVITVLPSLQNSMKIAALGDAIGLVSEDRFAGIGGTLGVTPPELAVALNVATAGAPTRAFHFQVLHDPSLTPLFAYVAVLNALTSTYRQAGPLSIGLTGTIDFGAAGTLTIDDAFSGDQAFPGVANAVLGPIAAMMTNDWQSVAPTRMTLDVAVAEAQDGATIERAWLDTARPRYGATHTLYVQLRRYRGGLETRTMPVTMPASGPAKLTLVVADAPTLAGLEDKELDPALAHSVPELLTGLNRMRRNNRLYVRLLAPATGAIVGGRALPALPGSTRGVLDGDPSAAPTAVSRAVVGQWDDRAAFVIRGSREVPLTLSAPIR